MRYMVQFIVWVLWLLCISIAEAGLIIVSTNQFGAAWTFCFFGATVLAGVLIQAVRWSRYKLIRDKRNALAATLRAKYRVSGDWRTAPEALDWSRLRFEMFQYHLTTMLFIFPGLLFHIVGLLLVVPATRRTAWFFLIGTGSYEALADWGYTRKCLPRAPRRLRR